MPAAPAASFLDTLLGLQIGGAGQEAGNRCSVEGLSWGAGQQGGLEIGARRIEAVSLRVAAGPVTLDVGRLVLHNATAQVRMEAGRPRLYSLRAADAELAGVELQGPLEFPQHAAGHAQAHLQGARAPGDRAAGLPAADAWSLAPLATADGTIRAQIVDAALMFDADVTVPIRQGQIDFNQATVAHVGPDSRMGVSRMGIYVDAPNGRSYLVQFASAPLSGVEFERRGALLGAFVFHRGSLRLQPFAEGLLRQAGTGFGLALTEQTRTLLGRTAMSGEVRLGDGRFAAPGVQADLVGRAQGGNTVRVHSEAVGRGLIAEMASLSVRGAALQRGATQLHCDEMGGRLVLRLFVADAQWRFAFDIESLKLAGLRLGTQATAAA